MGCIVSKSTNVVNGIETNASASSKGFDDEERNDGESINTINSKSEEILIESQKGLENYQHYDQAITLSELNDETSDSLHSNSNAVPNAKISLTNGYQPDKYNSIMDGEPEDSTPKNESRMFKGIFTGQRLLCKDEFYSKYTNEKMYRWRQAEIANVDGDDNGKALIHFVGWAESFDQWINVSTEWYKLAPIGLLSKVQCDKGMDLDENEIKAVKQFLLYGSEVTIARTNNRPISSRDMPDTAPFVRNYSVAQYVSYIVYTHMGIFAFEVK